MQNVSYASAGALPVQADTHRQSSPEVESLSEGGCAHVAIHAAPPLLTGRSWLPLDTFDFDRIPKSVMTQFLVPQLELEERLVFGATSPPIGKVMDDAGARSPIFGDYYALKLAPRRHAAALVARQVFDDRPPDQSALQKLQFDVDKCEADREVRVAGHALNRHAMFIASRCVQRGQRAVTVRALPALCARLEVNMSQVPHDVQPYVQAATWLIRWQQPQAALKILLRCEQLEPNRLEIYRQMAKAHWQLGDTEASFAAALKGMDHARAPSPDCEQIAFGLIALDDAAGAIAVAQQFNDQFTFQFAQDASEALARPASARVIVERWDTDKQRAARMPAAIGDARSTFDKLGTLSFSPDWHRVLDELALPLYDKFHGDPRFVYLLRRIGPDIETMKAIRLSIPESFFDTAKPAEGKQD